MAIKPKNAGQQHYRNLWRDIKYSEMLTEYKDAYDEVSKGMNQKISAKEHANIYKNGFIYLHSDIIKNDFTRSACQVAESAGDLQTEAANLMKMCMHNQSAFFYDVEIQNENFVKRINPGGVDFFNSVCDVFRHDNCKDKIPMPNSCTPHSNVQEVENCEESHHQLYCKTKDYKSIDVILRDMFSGNNQSYCGLEKNKLNNSREKIKEALDKLDNFKGCRKAGHTDSEKTPEDYEIKNPRKPKDEYVQPGKVKDV
jgi:hypothetical protein